MTKKFNVPYYNWNSASGAVRNRKGEQVGKISFIEDKLDNNIYLSYVVVKPNFQSRGLGRRFVNQLIKFAKKEGVREIELFACPIRNQKLELKKLKSFYRSFGFRKKIGGGIDDMVLKIK